MSIESITFCNGVTDECISDARIYLVKLIGLAFVDFLPIMLFIPSQVFFMLVRLA